jgi:MoaA/NifB/PqqE/SkfB family radical SAM enzyme
MLRFHHLFRTGLGVMGHRLFGIRRPLNVMLALTNRCTAHCRYCNIPIRDPRDLTPEQVLRLVDEIASAGAVRLGLWGGEPLLREDLGAIVRRARSRGLYVTLDTNGALWRERMADLAGLDHVIFGLDGTEAHHDANRGSGTHAKVLEAIGLARTMPGLNVWTITVLNRLNLGDVDGVLDLAERLGFRCTFQVLHHNEHMGRNHEDLMPSNEEYRAVLRHVLKRKREGARVASSARYLNFLLRWPDFRVSTAAAPHLGLRCRAGSLYANVDANGEVYACSLLVGKAPAANALEVGFHAAFEAIPPLPCQGCTAGCFTEYNYLYSLDGACIWDWMRSMIRG